MTGVGHQVLDSAYLWQSRWYTVRQDRLRAPDGSDYLYTVVEHPGSVVIVPVTTDGQVVLIWQYRHPVGSYCLEVPAGGLTPGLTPEQAARRELLEEVGGQAQELLNVGRFFPSNGISDEVAHVFLATGVELGQAHREPMELMEVRLVSVAEALRLARSGAMSCGRSALALYWCEPYLCGGQTGQPPACCGTALVKPAQE